MTNEELQQMFAETARIRELANPAAVPYSDFQVPASNVAPSSFASNLGGLLFGGADSGLNEYLSREQQKQMQSQALMSAAMSLLKNSGYTTRPIGLGEALGSAYEAGTAGYQGAQKNAIEQMLTKQKLDEYKRQVADEEAYRNMFTQMPTAGAPMTPIQALSVGGGQAGPTPQRAAMIGQPMPAGTATTGGMPALTQVQMDILRRMPAKEGRAELLKLSQPPEITGQAFKGADGNYYYMTKQGPIPASIAPADLGAEEFGAAVPEVVGGQTQMVQYNKKGDRRVVTGVMPYEKPEASPAEVKLLEAAKMPITIENIMAIRRSGAANITQNAEKGGLALAYEQGVKDLAASRDMARSANATLANIDRILPALDTAITGPAADFRATLLRVGKQLNVAGADADQILKNTATVVQGLAQQELDAASQMRGQGTLTDAERAILRRAAGGDVSLTAGELRVGLLAAQRSARARAESHGQLLSTAVRTIPSLAQIAPMYEVPVYGAPAANPLQNAVQQEIDRRKASGGKR
jgi:hypothetical protein